MIVAAVANLSGTGGLGPRDAYLSKRIEQAMSHAIIDAMAEGIDINDSEKIRERMLQARAAVVQESRGR